MSVQSHECAVLSEVLSAHRSLLSATDIPSAVAQVLEKVGVAAKVDRVYIFAITKGDEGEAVASQRYEWASAKVKPEIDNPDLQSIPLRAAGYGRWLDSFSAFQPIYGMVGSFPQSERPTLEAQQILSIVILPIFADGTLWGFVGFDDCSSARDWSDGEVDLLVSLTVALGITLGGSGRSAVDTATAASLGLVGRLLEVHTATFSDTPTDVLMQRTQARVRTLIESHRFLTGIGSSSTVCAGDMLRALVPYWNQIRSCGFSETAGEIRIDAEPILLDLERGLDLLIILTDVLAVLSCSADGAGAVERLGISLKSASGRAELTVTALGADGTPANHRVALDGMATVLVRRLQEHLRATVVPVSAPGLLFRLSFPES